jgi:hypothetical protein
VAILIPFHKRGAKNICENYRGISLLVTTFKIFTAIIDPRRP